MTKERKTNLQNETDPFSSRHRQFYNYFSFFCETPTYPLCSAEKNDFLTGGTINIFLVSVSPYFCIPTE